ncbi:MBL fold metallo-hydrolase [Chitinophaga agri]|uniref:MBL fold metallo-hydrolase n=2 Tax=Chitinophaga agri TaxID=2703787 RepID=A0A6B9ZQK9_9BACT|nr:MBL fold metallo-hydrolase [Chitinophaga agri]
MKDKKLYLKPNVVIEPLIDRWYAWTHLISPAPAAMNILKRHMEIMNSYLAAPEFHADAVLNPKLRGGPFMDLKGGRLEEVEGLLKNIHERYPDLIAFAKAIKELDEMLLQEAKGFGLEETYRKVPELLKGYVELHYDRHNNPGFRFFESLLYKSPFYKKEMQSIALWITRNDERPFCLSTPRLDEADVLHLNIPFDHTGIDELAKMKKAPQSLDYIRALLGIADTDMPLFETFFTEEAPAPYNRYTGKKIRMRYFGHACILIETDTVNILIDPLVSYYGYYSSLDHFSDLDLPEVIDFVLITHNHQDHILFETLLPLRHRIKNIIVPASSTGKLEDPDLKLMFNTIGFNNVIGLKEMESIQISDTVITGLPFTGEHSDLNILTKACYLVEVSGFKLMFLADSRIIEPALYKHIRRETGDVDVMFLGMECDGAPLSWLYGPLLTRPVTREQDFSRRLAGSDCGKGVSLIEIFEPKEVYVYAMGQEPWVEFISSIKYDANSNPIVQANKLLDYCKEKEIIAELLYGEKELLYNRKTPAFY